MESLDASDSNPQCQSGNVQSLPYPPPFGLDDDQKTVA